MISEVCKEYGGLIIIVIGVLLLIGAICRWKWTLDLTGQRTGEFKFVLLMYDLLGEKGSRIGMIIISILIVIGGVGLLFVTHRQ